MGQFLRSLKRVKGWKFWKKASLFDQLLHAYEKAYEYHSVIIMPSSTVNSSNTRPDEAIVRLGLGTSGREVDVTVDWKAGHYRITGVRPGGLMMIKSVSDAIVRIPTGTPFWTDDHLIREWVDEMTHLCEYDRQRVLGVRLSIRGVKSE
jgi:hypothetical protein